MAILMLWAQDSVSSLEEWGRPVGGSQATDLRDHGQTPGQTRTSAPERAPAANDMGLNEVQPIAETKSEESADVFRQKLRELELDRLVSLNCAGHDWLVSGELSDEEMTRFKSMLERFKRDYPLAGPIVDSVHRVSDALPFRIVEASLSRNPSITLSDGQRLFVGDTYAGYRLEAVTQNRIVLAGKHRLALAW
jgi:type III secretion system YscD/HrpQ family protein